MAAVDTEPAPVRTRSSRRTVILCAVVLAVVSALFAIGARYYYRADLFDDYRAGYASVDVSAPEQRPALMAGTIQPCMDAVAAAYPEDDLDGPRSDAWRAFSSGCNMKLDGLPLGSVWLLHTWLGDGREND